MSAHAIDMTGQTVGRRTVLGRAPATNKRRDANWRVRCACGREGVVSGAALRTGRADQCLQCANDRKVYVHRSYLTRPTLEVLLLAAEHDIVRATLASAELGGAQHNWWGVFRTSVRKGLLTKQRWGAYALAPAGLAILRDVAEGRITDRWGMRAEIVAALDGGRASGRRTLRGAA